MNESPDHKINRRRISWIPTITLAYLIILVLTAIFAGVIAPHSPTSGDLYDRLTPPSWVEGGSTEFLLGTDFMGRDVLSRIIYGARISLLVAFLAIGAAGSIGACLGVLAGYFGGKVDNLIMRLTDMAMAIPLILMAIILVALFGASLLNIILVLVLLLWPRYARQIRVEVLSVKEEEFVSLARIAGCSHLRIMWKHIIPNVMPTMLVIATLQVGWVIILESSLSFLGVGIPRPEPAWGVMVADARGLIATAWWIALFPGLLICFTVLSLNLLGDWIRDRLDPKLRVI